MEENEDKALPITNDTVFPAGAYKVYISGIDYGKNITTNINNLGTLFEDPFFIGIENKTTGQKWEHDCTGAWTNGGDFLPLGGDLKVKIRKRLDSELMADCVKACIVEVLYHCVFLGEAEFPEGFAFSDLSCEYSNINEWDGCGNFEIHHKNADGSEISLDIGIYDSRTDSDTLYIYGEKVDIDDSEYDADELFEHLGEIDENDSASDVYRKLKVIKNGEIPEGVTQIDSEAYSYKYDLRSVTLPESLLEIGVDAFSGCSALSEIKFSGTAEQWKAVKKGWGWHESCPAKFVQCADGTACDFGQEEDVDDFPILEWSDATELNDKKSSFEIDAAVLTWLLKKTYFATSRASCN